MPLRRISSLLTLPLKFLFLPVYAVSFVNFFLLGWWGPLAHIPEFPPGWFLIVIAGIFTVQGILFWPIKRVLIDDANQMLYVSNYRKEVAIPFSEIADVKESIWSDPRKITVHLQNETEFGKKIVFLSTYRFGGWLASQHPIVDELRIRIAQSQV